MAQLPSASTIKDIIAALQAMECINQKADLFSVIGSPALITDEVATLITTLQNQKNSLAANITVKGTVAVGTETIKSLVDKVASLPVKRSATGSFTATAAYSDYTVTGLAFKPTLVFLYSNSTTSTSNRQFTTLVDYNRIPTNLYYSGAGKLKALTNYGTPSSDFNSTSTTSDTTINNITADGFSVRVQYPITLYWLAIE
ncbi:hypothetical protein NST23_24615 [Brevibacillus sp. FSL K6-0770]|uniref:hypothetical protein n=1 Tax=Brevibacillus sp. FSL K6-0770 TaxID=2954673 RepID=UPI0030FC544A